MGNRDDATPFLDEVRSDRGWALGVVLLGTAALTAVGSFLLHAALTQPAKPLFLRLLVGGVFGAGFLAIFGASSIVLARRLLRPPVRVRIDRSGVHIGERSTEWTEIEKVRCRMQGGRAHLAHRTASPSGWIRIPGQFSSAEAGRLLDGLEDHFAGSGSRVEIEIR